MVTVEKIIVLSKSGREVWKGKFLNRRKSGTFYENIASHYLEEQGFRIREKNYRITRGEIDIIAENDDYVIFVEVKYRKDHFYGYPWEAVTKAKQKRICKAAGHFCYTRNIQKQIRYDVISICGEEIFWFQNAFFHIEN